MAIRSSAGRSYINIFNSPNLAPPPSPVVPIVFQNFDSVSNFTLGMWAKVVEPFVGDVLWAILGSPSAATNFQLWHDQSKWYLKLISGPLTVFNQPIAAFFQDRWTLICVTKQGPDIKVYIGMENDPPVDTDPVQLGLELSFTTDVEYDFYAMHLVQQHQVAICNFKYWTSILTIPQMIEQMNRWDVVPPSGTPVPIWVSTFRTPGDISNVVNPYAAPTPTWNAAHAYTSTSPDFPGFLFYTPDPAFMALHSPCPTWVYPLFGVNDTIFVNVNPGATPAVDTMFKSTDFWSLDDRGAIPIVPVPDSIEVIYCAFPFSTNPGVERVSSWPLLIDDNGVESPIDFNQSQNRFEVDTSVVITRANLKAINLYHWKFGGQFQYPINPAGLPTATANLGFPRILVTYTGFPTGDSTPPPALLTGLFALNKKGKSVDRYNGGIELKIPNPTIRTAFIGE